MDLLIMFYNVNAEWPLPLDRVQCTYNIGYWHSLGASSNQLPQKVTGGGTCRRQYVAEVGGLGVDVYPGHQALAEEGGLLVRHDKSRLFVVDADKYTCHQELPLHREPAEYVTLL